MPFTSYGDCTYGDGFYKGTGYGGIVHPEGTENLFYFEPNWQAGVSVKYRFETVIAETRQKREQRRPMLLKPYRREKFTVLVDTADNKMLNYLKRNHARQVFVPIYTEPVLLSNAGLINGNTTLSTIDTTDYWNLNNQCTEVILIDMRDDINAEIKFLDSVASNTIALQSAISGAFDAEKTVVYPILYALLETKNIRDYTDNIAEYELEFSEYQIYNL